MFSIVTTQPILEKLYAERSVWGDIVGLTKKFYVRYESDWWEEDGNPLLELSNAGANIVNKSDMVDSLTEHPEQMANYATSVFILDIEEKKARELSAKYGVIVQSASHLNDSILTEVSPELIILEEAETGFSWRKILAGVKNLPSNAIIINDRYLFTNDEVIKTQTGEIDKDKRYGLENVFNILNEILPSQLGVPYHILVVFQEGQLKSTTTFKNMGTYLNKLRKRLSRPYDLVIEVLAVKSSSEFYKDTHHRRVFTNYGILCFEQKVNAFVENRSNCSQSITISRLFTHSLDGKNTPDEKKQSIYLKAFSNYVTDIKTRPISGEHLFIKNGNADLTVADLENRMVLCSCAD